MLFRVQGKGAKDAFAFEAGGHRFQRRRKSRVHSSTVTVAVLDLPSQEEIEIRPQDLDESFTRGSGKGGQHRNKTDSCVQLRHEPSGITVRVETERSQFLNRQLALSILRARLKEDSDARRRRRRSKDRKGQVGTGMRADKTRTVALQRDTVTDHRSGKTMRAKLYLRGQIRQLR